MLVKSVVWNREFRHGNELRDGGVTYHGIDDNVDIEIGVVGA